MCGISLLLRQANLVNADLLHTKSAGSCSNECLGELKKYLFRRGPDSYNSVTNQKHLLLTASVLHLRGTSVVDQPIQNKNNNILLWNGEVFDGLDVKDDDNDTLRVFELLNRNDDLSVSEMKHIEGPFAFIYFNSKKNQIWFGRDRLGRRSLLFNSNKKNNAFALSSVPYNSQLLNSEDWFELPNSGIFVLDLNENKFEHHSWTNNESNELLIHSKLDILSLFQAQSNNDATNIIVSDVLSNVSYNDITNAFLNVLSNSIRKRVAVPKSSKSLHHRYIMSSPNKWISDAFVDGNRIENLNKSWIKQQDSRLQITQEASVSLLYSGGIDSQILAALCDQFVPKDEYIDLINVVCGDNPMQSPDRLTAINGILELKKCINPKRKWRLIEVNITLQEIDNAKKHILSLIHPCTTIMDFNIGNILWFGARGIGNVRCSTKHEYQWITNHDLIRYSHIDLLKDEQYQKKLGKMNIEELVTDQITKEFEQINLDNILNNDKNDKLTAKKKLKKHRNALHKLKKRRAKEIKRNILQKLKSEIYEKVNKNDDNDCKDSVKQELYISASRVILSGFGSDELLAGYGRHRTSFKIGGEQALKRELDKDFARLWKRNLGRDDRLISDHSREARWPFLDEQFISFVQRLPIKHICDLTQPIGIGDKKLLRDCAKKIGLEYSWSLVKRAIQFGSRIANNKVAGYANIDKNLNIKDLVNCQVYKYDNNTNGGDNESQSVINTKLTKKYNKKHNKHGYQ